MPTHRTMPLWCAALLTAVPSQALLIAMPPQEQGWRIPLTETVRVDGSQPDLYFTRISDVVVAPGGGFYALDRSAQVVFQFDSSGGLIREIGRKGQGPGEFALAYRLLLDGDTLHVFDAMQNLVHVFSSTGELQRSRRVPYVASTAFTVAKRMASEHWIGVSEPRFTWNMVAGVVGTPGQVMVMPREGREARTLLSVEWLVSVWYGEPNGLPWGPTSVGFGVSGHWDVVGDSVVVVADGLSGVVERYRVGADSVELAARIDTGLAGERLSDGDRRVLMDLERRSEDRIPANAGWVFPERIPGITGVIVDSHGYLWLRKRVDTAEDWTYPNWRVMAPQGDRWADVVLPDGLDVMDISDNRVFGVSTGALDVPVIQVLEFERSELMAALRRP